MNEDEQINVAFIDWINTFTLTTPAKESRDLIDGRILLQVLNGIDAKFFPVSLADVPFPTSSNNWVLLLNILRKVLKLILRYYDGVLGQPTTKLDIPNLNIIAKREPGNEVEMRKLAQLIVALAVQCERNQVFIEKIRNLPEDKQHAMMRAIENVMESLQMAAQEEEEEYFASFSTPKVEEGFDFTDTDAELLQLKSELKKEQEKRIKLETLAKNQAAELNRIHANNEELFDECQELRRRVGELDRLAMSMSDDGMTKNESMLRAELDHLKQDLELSESRRDELVHQLDLQSIQIVDLTRKLEDSLRKSELVNKLKEQLQEYKHVSEKLASAEHKVEQYKKKLEETADLKKKVKSLEGENEHLLSKLEKIHSQPPSANKQMVDKYKNQLEQMIEKVNQLTVEKSKLEYEKMRAVENQKLLEAERQRDKEVIVSYEERLREAISLDTKQDNDAPVTNAQSERLIFEMKRKLAQKEKENEILRQETKEIIDVQRLILLESLLDDANRLKDKFERDNLEAQKKNALLEYEINRLKNANQEQIVVNSEDEVMLEKIHHKELAELTKKVKGLEAELKEARLNLGKGAQYLQTTNEVDPWKNEESIKLENTDRYALTRRIVELENETRLNLEKMNHLLFEKDQLQSQIVDLKDQLVNNIGIQRLAEENKELSTQIKQLQVKLQKAKDFIRQQDKLVKDNKVSGEMNMNHELVVAGLQHELRQREEDLTRSRDLLQDMSRMRRREQELLTSAWYMLGTQVLRETLTGGGGGGTSRAESRATAPNTWLLQQRRSANILYTSSSRSNMRIK